MMHRSSRDGGGATEIVKGEVELHSARSKSGPWQQWGQWSIVLHS